MGAAIALSYAHGWEGRVGLHSPPGAEDFYGNPKKCGMARLGIDASHGGLTYYAITSTQARAFLEKLKRAR
jgi:hypothetical protein